MITTTTTTDRRASEMTKRVRAISTLKREAGRAARQRGHAIRWFRALTGVTWQSGGCRCGAYIHVEQMPGPNGVEISGDAVAVDHEAMIGSGAPSGEASRDERPAKDERKMFLSYCRDPQCCEVGRRMHLVPQG